MKRPCALRLLELVLGYFCQVTADVVSEGPLPAGEDSQGIHGLIGDASAERFIRQHASFLREHQLKDGQPELDVPVNWGSFVLKQLQQWENEDEGRISATHSIGSTINKRSVAAYSGGEGGGGHETQLQFVPPKPDDQHGDDLELGNGRDSEDQERGLCENCHLRRKTKTNVSVTTRDVDDNGGAARSPVPDFCPLEPFERYMELHHKIIEGTADQRYLVYRPYLACGMGNRMSGFQGTLALAMMTDRALLVDWRGGLKPSPKREKKYEDNFLEPNVVELSTVPASIKDYETNSSTEIWCQMTKGVQILDECPTDRTTNHFLGTASWDDIYAAETPVVVMEAHNQNPLYFLRDNEGPDVAEVLRRFDEEIGADTFRICAMRFLYRPRQEFGKEYCRARSEVLAGKFATVSLHVRTGDNPQYHPEWRDSLPQDIENFIACATGFEEGLMSIANSSDPLGLPHLGETVETVWLLGTDNNSVLELLRKGNHTVDTGGKVAFIEGKVHHRVHSGSKGGSNNNEGPLLDMALLSESVLLVGSYHSTFSMHVSEVGGLPPQLRVYLKSPFAKLFGNRGGYGVEPAAEFSDFREGCRDIVDDPDSREYLKKAIETTRKPFVNCQGFEGS